MCARRLMDEIVNSFLSTFSRVTQLKPTFPPYKEKKNRLTSFPNCESFGLKRFKKTCDSILKNTKKEKVCKPIFCLRFRKINEVRSGPESLKKYLIVLFYMLHTR